MYFKYGNYAHGVGLAGAAIQKTALENEKRQIIAFLNRWDVEGWLIGSSEADIDGKLTALMNAYAVNGLDAALVLGGSAGNSVNSVISSQTLGGVRVVSLSLPDFKGAQRATHLTFNVTLEWESPVAQANQLMRSFVETLSFRGTCGPRHVFLLPPVGLPIRQIGKQRTIQEISQRGRAVGYRNYPTASVPAPIWLNLLDHEASEVSHESPKAAGSDYYDFAINWNYVFHSATNLNATKPNAWK